MTVKTKLISTFVVFDLVLTLLITLGTYLIINDRATFIEDQYAKRSIDQLKEIIASDIQNLSKINKDYAYWDETYSFIQDNNDTYRRINLTQTNFGDTLNLDFAYFITTNRQLVAAWHSQSTDVGDLPTETASLSALLRVYDDLKSQNMHEPEGIVWLPSGLAYVSVKQIVPSNRDKKPNGYMVMGYRIDAAKLRDISNRLKFPISLESDINSSVAQPFSFEKDSDRVYGKLSIVDILGNRRGYFSIVIPRDIYAAAKMAFSYIVFLMVSLFTVSLLFVLRFNQVVFGSILHRISYLNMKAKSAVQDDYAAPLNYCHWENSHDELGELARSVEQMRVAAYESTSTLKRTVEEKTKELSIRLDKEEKTAQAVVYLLDREKQHSKELADKEDVLMKLTDELKKKNVDLKEANQVKNEFVNIATHQIKNPLAALRGFVGMIRQGIYGQVSSKLKEPLDQISICTEQMVSLVEDMLKISRSEEKNYPMNIQSVNMMEIVSGVIHQMEPQALQKKLKLKYWLSKDAPLVQADADKVKDVVTNLLSNAIKYSEKGTITITHSYESGIWTTSVADQGYGISHDEQKQIFARFYRTRDAIARDIPGTGLGLYIIKEYVTRMNGKVWLESEEGKGSTFSFSLPKA